MEVLEKWAKQQGIDKVKLKLLEEIFELSTCVLQHVNKGIDNRNEVITEVCDVEIMLEQYASLVNITSDDLVAMVKHYFTDANNKDKLIRAILKLSTCTSYLVCNGLDSYGISELMLAVDTIIEVFGLTKKELKERKAKVLCRIQGIL